MSVHRARQTLRGYPQTSEPLDGLYDPSIGSETAITQGVSA